jgi:D-sedoheptulose 7-phosphate isomerase
VSAPERDYRATLYPFLPEHAAVESEAGMATVMRDVRQSIVQKCDEVVALRRAILAEYAGKLETAAVAVAAAFRGGATLLAFGNGGSATDADDAVADCGSPPYPHWRPLPALSLASDVAVLTAVANDVGVEHVFSRQILAWGAPGDVALGISTSGNSLNVLAGLSEARRRGLVTVGFAGGDGGAMAGSAAIEHCFVARSAHIPRIQEGHATLWHALLELVQARLA